MRLKQQIIAILTICFISPVFAQDPGTEQRMVDHCQKRHPEMSIEQCRAMYQNIKNMPPKQRVEGCKRNPPELSAEPCQKKYGSST